MLELATAKGLLACGGHLLTMVKTATDIHQGYKKLEQTERHHSQNMQQGEQHHQERMKQGREQLAFLQKLYQMCELGRQEQLGYAHQMMGYLKLILLVVVFTAG